MCQRETCEPHFKYINIDVYFEMGLSMATTEGCDGNKRFKRWVLWPSFPVGQSECSSEPLIPPATDLFLANQLSSFFHHGKSTSHPAPRNPSLGWLVGNFPGPAPSDSTGHWHRTWVEATVDGWAVEVGENISLKKETLKWRRSKSKGYHSKCCKETCWFFLGEDQHLCLSMPCEQSPCVAK